MDSRLRCALLSVCALMTSFMSPASTRAQEAHAHHQDDSSATSPSTAGSPDAAMQGAEHAMSGSMTMSAHMKMTPRRTATHQDSVRALAIADTLRRAIEKYRDVTVARADGFKQFAPGIKNQRIYHFTNNRHALREQFSFDPSEPTSLLYKKDAAGQFVLVGAMFVAPRRATLEELDQRIPSSIAQWHAHTNICVPPLRQRARWREMRNGVPVFGPAGAVSTEEECKAVGGRFHPQIFGWMVHANVIGENQLSHVWGDHH